MSSTSSIVIDTSGTQLSYIDSGVPPIGSEYITIFAVHGLGFTKYIFQKIMAVAPRWGMRIVAINRRNYPGSTPFTPAEAAVLTDGTDVQKAQLVKDIGVQFGTFVDLFIQQEGLSAISSDGKTGGIMLMGWSLGNALTLSMITNFDALPADVQLRLAARMRAHIMLVALGLPIPPKTWSPNLEGAADEFQVGYFVQWITSYFNHGDLSKRDIDTLSYFSPDTTRVPSIYHMTDAEISQAVHGPPVIGADGLYMTALSSQFLHSFRGACFGRSVREILPRLKTSVVTGDSSASYMLAAFWSIQDEDKAHGGGLIKLHLIDGMNHFMHWEEPELTLRIFQSMLA